MATNRESDKQGKPHSASFLETSIHCTADRCSTFKDSNSTSDAKSTWTVEEVIAKLLEGTPVPDSPSPVSFFQMLERLKTTKREGWRRAGILQYVLPNFCLLQN